MDLNSRTTHDMIIKVSREISPVVMQLDHKPKSFLASLINYKEEVKSSNFSSTLIHLLLDHFWGVLAILFVTSLTRRIEIDPPTSPVLHYTINYLKHFRTDVLLVCGHEEQRKKKSLKE